MRIRGTVLGVVLAAGSVLVGHADTVRTFHLVLPETYDNGDHIDFDGNLTVDTTTGAIQSAEVFNDFSPEFDANTITGSGVLTKRGGGGGGGGGGIAYAISDAYGQSYEYISLKDTSNGSYFQLNLDTSSLVNYDGGGLCGIQSCTFSIHKGQYQYDGGSVTRGTAVLMSTNEPPPPVTTPLPDPSPDPAPMPSGPTSVTPEPSSLSLLGLGLVGVAGVVKRQVA